jgi:hypothetical protein
MERKEPQKRWCFCGSLKATYKTESKDIMINAVPNTVATSLPDRAHTCLKLILSFHLLTPKELFELYCSCKKMKTLIYSFCDFFTIDENPTIDISVRKMKSSKDVEFLFNGLFLFPVFGEKNIQCKYFAQHNVCALTLQNDRFKTVHCFHKNKFMGFAQFTDLREQSLEYFHSFFTQGLNVYFSLFTSGGLRIFFAEQNRSFDLDYVHEVVREEGNNILCYSFRWYKYCIIQAIIFENGAMNVYFKYVFPLVSALCTIEGIEKIMVINDEHTKLNLDAALNRFLYVDSSKWKDVPGTRLEISVKLQDVIPKYSQILFY